MGRGGERSQGKLRFEFRLLLGTGLRDYNDGCPTSRPGEEPTNPHQASPPTQPKDTTFGLHNQRHLSPRTSSRNEFKVQELRCIYDSIYSVAPPHELRYGYCSVLNLHKKSSAGTFKTFSAVPSEPSRFVIAIP